MQEFIYRKKRFIYSKKVQLLEMLCNEFDLKQIHYTAFNVWASRISRKVSFDDKIRLYFDYQIARKAIDDNQADGEGESEVLTPQVIDLEQPLVRIYE